MTAEQAETEAAAFKSRFLQLKDEIGKFMVGQDALIEDVLTAAICGGHVLLEGVPGLGKTSLVHSLAQALDLDFRRVQFTPDLLPADILGTQVLVEKAGQRQLEFQQGPVFCHVLLADEINRATPKTQSALLETMQEQTVTVAGVTHRLPTPFMVLATQNPIEHDGTYPLPEAQLDRFFFKLLVPVPTEAEWMTILDRTTTGEPPQLQPVATGPELLHLRAVARAVPVSREIQQWLVRTVLATHPDASDAPETIRRYVRHGASPRGAQAVLSAARVRALLDGRTHVAREDVQAVAPAALRHRLILSFEGEADGVKPDEVLKALWERSA
ncbi:MAG: MoxR family ATPase [Verrucomicrobiales bacterium]|nr:MoxR family ATPase [Verrucomicrobiales bacterium]